MNLFCNVIDHFGTIPSSARDMLFLRADNWNDYHYHTLFHLLYVDRLGGHHKVGDVKIGRKGMIAHVPPLEDDVRTPKLKGGYEELPKGCFSLGQDETYYKKLCEFDRDTRERILVALRDIAYSEALFVLALKEHVTKVSLLRSVTKDEVTFHFRRLAEGNTDPLGNYKFRFEANWLRDIEDEEETNEPDFDLLFEVDPKSVPRTNLHVLIGRNGVGKTTLLNCMADSLLDRTVDDAAMTGQFKFEESGGRKRFSNVVFVSFSVFDPFPPLREERDKSQDVLGTYIGIKRKTALRSGKESGRVFPPKTPKELVDEFAETAVGCSRGQRAVRWVKAMTTLIARDGELEEHFGEVLKVLRRYADFEREPPVNMIITASAAEAENKEIAKFKRSMRAAFRPLSSGHKIVLLSLTKLVERLQTQSLVLVDEPESHLHPPLLSGFIRALSDLLHDRNSAAIIATHSPVVLQEVQRNCVWKLKASGRERAVRPARETFGENVAVLTSDVFGLQIEDAGYYDLIEKQIAMGMEIDEALEKFGSRMGGDAKAIMLTLFARAKKK